MSTFFDRGGRAASTALVFCAAVALGLSGCSEAPVSSAEAYVEPGWMAQMRQEIEQYQSEMLGCLDEFGVKGIVTIGGRVLTGGITDDEGDLPPGVAELNETAATECNARVKEPSLWVAPVDAAAYARMLDVRACLVAQGHEIPEAPSEESWIEQASSDVPWNPYLVLTEPGATTISDEDLAALMEACPQSGQGMYLSAPAEAFE